MESMGDPQNQDLKNGNGPKIGIMEANGSIHDGWFS